MSSHGEDFFNWVLDVLIEKYIGPVLTGIVIVTFISIPILIVYAFFTASGPAIPGIPQQTSEVVQP